MHVPLSCSVESHTTISVRLIRSPTWRIRPRKEVVIFVLVKSDLLLPLDSCMSKIYSSVELCYRVKTVRWDYV